MNLEKIIKDSVREVIGGYYTEISPSNLDQKYIKDKTDTKTYYQIVGRELGKLIGVSLKLQNFILDSSNEYREMDFVGKNTDIHLKHDWRKDGTPTKPWTTMTINSEGLEDVIEVGRFAIWSDDMFGPKEYAEDLYSVLKKYITIIKCEECGWEGPISEVAGGIHGDPYYCPECDADFIDEELYE